MKFSRQPKPAVDNVRWSKDYVEHLRAVHFALIVSCAALIVLISSGRAYDPDQVIQQIDRINSFKAGWAETWLRFLQAQDLPGIQPKSNRPATPGAVPLSSCTYLKADNRYFHLSISESPRLVLFEYGPFGPLSKTDPSSGKAIATSTFPEVIRDFAYIWDHSATVLKVDSLLPKGEFVDGAYRPSYFTDPNFRSNGSFVCTAQASTEAGELTLDGWAVENKQLLVLMRNPLGRTFALHMIPAWITYSPRENLRMDVSQTSASADFQAEFPDLNIAVGNNGYQTWEGLRKLIADEAGRGESFEALGLKFPASQITAWGILVILLLQMYLAVYLIQLGRKQFTVDDTGAHVPWIGVNMSFPGRMIYFATVTALPWLSVLLLCARTGVRALGRGASFGWQFWNWKWEQLALATKLQTGFLFLALLLAVILGYACWRNRPRLTPQGGNNVNQLFE